MKMDRWLIKLVTGLLATAAMEVQIQTALKNHIRAKAKKLLAHVGPPYTKKINR
jgi:hypothetical protein